MCYSRLWGETGCPPKKRRSSSFEPLDRAGSVLSASPPCSPSWRQGPSDAISPSCRASHRDSASLRLYGQKENFVWSCLSPWVRFMPFLHWSFIFCNLISLVFFLQWILHKRVFLSVRKLSCHPMVVDQLHSFDVDWRTFFHELNCFRFALYFPCSCNCRVPVVYFIELK